MVDPEPRVVAFGRTPRALIPLKDVVRGRHRGAICAAVDVAVKSKRPVDKLRSREGFRVVAEPFLSARGLVNAVRVCTVPYPSVLRTPDGLPERLPTGAWVWDLNRSVTMPSPELYDMYAVPEEMRRPEMSAAEWMSHVAKATQVHATALATTAVGEHGDEILEVWQVRRMDGVLRDMRLAGRIEQLPEQRWLHGITVDITEGDSANNPSLSFAECVIEAEQAFQQGVCSVIVDLRDLRPVRWLSDPPNTLQWRQTGDPDRDPAVHPDDIPLMRSMFKCVVTGPVQEHLRVRDVDGYWQRVHCSAVRTAMDQDRGVYAALVKFQTDSSCGFGLRSPDGSTP